MSVRRREQNENAITQLRKPVLGSKKAIGENAKVSSTSKPVGRPGSSVQPSKDTKEPVKPSTKTPLATKRSALTSLSNGTAQPTQPTRQPLTAKTSRSTLTKTPAKAQPTKTPGKTKKALSIYTPAREGPRLTKHQKVEEEDEVEYMPPTALDMPHQPNHLIRPRGRDDDLFESSDPTADPFALAAPPRAVTMENDQIVDTGLDDFAFEP